MRRTIIAHSDTDGICSAAIALARFPDARVFFSKPVSLLKELDEVDEGNVIICDIAVNKPDAVALAKKLAKRKDVLFFDHHPMPPGFKSAMKNVTFHHDERVSASELVYRAFKDAIAPERVWIALYGAIADYSEATPFIEEKMRNWDRRAIFFEVSSIVMGIKNEGFSDYGAKRRLVAELAKGTNPSQMPRLVESAREAVVKEAELYEEIKRTAASFDHVGYIVKLEHFGFRGPAALFAATVTDKPLGVAAFERGSHFDITLRAREPSLRLNDIAEKAAAAVGGSGGGHPHAAGARIPMSKLKEFLKKADELVDV